MSEIESIADIQRLVREGFTDWRAHGHVNVRGQDDLLIFNYSAMAQYEARWNFFERVSRGLILNAKTGEVVARAFDKFFNWGEGGRFSDAPIVQVTEKLDGSLGVLYRVDGSYRIATRGSFESEQAAWATAYLNANYDLSGLPEAYTLLFEIIFPDNRIVVDYEGRQDLVLLAIRNRFTGEFLPFADVQRTAEAYGFSLPKVYTFADVDALIDDATALDADIEGYVALFADGQRFKFKSLQYLKLHKLISALTFKNVLGAMQAGTIEQILGTVPDEFLDETKAWIAEIEATLARVQGEVGAAFAQAPKATRKDFALWVMANHKPLSKYLFAKLDGRDITPLIYQNHEWGHADDSDIDS